MVPYELWRLNWNWYEDIAISSTKYRANNRYTQILLQWIECEIWTSDIKLKQLYRRSYQKKTLYSLCINCDGENMSKTFEKRNKMSMIRI